MTEGRVKQIQHCLETRFSPQELLVKDQSNLHAGHAGAQDGRGHFDVRIVAEGFVGQSRLQRHQSVYSALGDLLESDIHALRIKALTPEEARS